MKIEGYFSGIKEANEAVEKLKSSGFPNAYVDLNDHFSMDTDPNQKEYTFFSTSSLSNLVTDAGVPGGRPEKSPAAAASPMVSGMGGFEEIADINYRVIAEVDSSSENQIKGIVESLGGTMQCPNLNIHERLQDVKLEDMDPHYLDE